VIILVQSENTIKKDHPSAGSHSNIMIFDFSFVMQHISSIAA